MVLASWREKSKIKSDILCTKVSMSPPRQRESGGAMPSLNSPLKMAHSDHLFEEVGPEPAAHSAAVGNLSGVQRWRHAHGMPDQINPDGHEQQ